MDVYLWLEDRYYLGTPSNRQRCRRWKPARTLGHPDLGNATQWQAVAVRSWQPPGTRRARHELLEHSVQTVRPDRELDPSGWRHGHIHDRRSVATPRRRRDRVHRVLLPEFEHGIGGQFTTHQRHGCHKQDAVGPRDDARSMGLQLLRHWRRDASDRRATRWFQAHRLASDA